MAWVIAFFIGWFLFGFWPTTIVFCVGFLIGLVLLLAQEERLQGHSGSEEPQLSAADSAGFWEKQKEEFQREIYSEQLRDRAQF